MTDAAEVVEGTGKTGEAKGMEKAVDFIKQEQYPRLLAEATPPEPIGDIAP